MAEKKIIIVVMDLKEDDEPAYFGPFENTDKAVYWATDRFRGHDWHWQEITAVEIPEGAA